MRKKPIFGLKLLDLFLQLEKFDGLIFEGVCVDMDRDALTAVGGGLFRGGVLLLDQPAPPALFAVGGRLGL